MILLLKSVFWSALFIVFYSYLGYGLLIWIWIKIRSFFSQPVPLIPQDKYEPEVTLVVAAYNEELFIERKLQNTFELDYPKDKLKLIFVADGSNDRTAEMIARYPRIQLLYKPEREGKVAAINRAMKHVMTPIVIFCDANTLLNKECIREIVKHYCDEKVGGVAGEKKIVDQSGDQNAAGAGEGIYWKYESILKSLDAKFYSVVGAAGELFSIRTALFEETHPNILLDDFIISMKICQRGYKVMYEPGAYAMEAPSLTMKDEQKRKIRISAGAFQSVILLKDLLNIFRYGRLSLLYISHRVFRWICCPILLPIIFITNAFLFFINAGALYKGLFLLQCVFYALAILGWIFALRNLKIKILYVPYYFVFMNAALYAGFFRFLGNKQTVLWEKANRKV
jgi:cellulose synthase/poly-beta-1,6-N-acetylglucosamine synthase-like glycosyltransferase